MKKTDITCVVLTKNEEKNIERCLLSIKELAERIIIVDSGSTDKTIEIAKKYNADVFTHPFKNYANQFNWAIDNTNIQTKWIYRIDADEFISNELKEEIIEQCNSHYNDDVNGFVMKFKIVFMKKWLKHGGNYPFYNLTIFKTGYGRYTERMMGEHIEISSGKTIILKNPCDHEDFKTLSVWINKHNWYADREVIDYLSRNIKAKQPEYYKVAKKTASLRDKIYYRLPMFLRCYLFYFYRQYVRFGFLDGRPGKIYNWLQAYWYRFLIDAKLYEARINQEFNETPGDLK